MSYDSKIKSAQTIIEDHNSNADSKIDFDEFLKNLREKGGTSDMALKAVSWEDLEKCGAPTIMARALAHLFRKDSGDNGGKSSYVSEKKATSLSNKELLERYSPKDSKSHVAKRLKDLSDGKPCIVFDDNSKVIVEESLKLLEDIMEGLDYVETAFVEGKPLDVYRIGDRPDFYVSENPLYPDEALRSNETCAHTGRTWKGVPTDVRQMLWIAVAETQELVVEAPSDCVDVFDKIVCVSDPIGSMRSRCPAASKAFDAASKIGKLPVLKIKVGETAKSGRGNNPFGENKAY